MKKSILKSKKHLKKSSNNVNIVTMKDTMIRGIPEDVWADILRIAGEEGTSANKILLQSVTDRVDTWRKTERRRLTHRLDELNQKTLL